MLTNTSLWNTQIFKKFEKVKVWKFSHLTKSAITFAQGCTMCYFPEGVCTYPLPNLNAGLGSPG